MEEKTIVNFTEEEVGKVTGLQQKVWTINTRLGEIELEIHQLETRFQSLKSEKQTIINSFSEVKAEEVELGKSLRDKYGEGTYDIRTNTFTPNK